MNLPELTPSQKRLLDAALSENGLQPIYATRTLNDLSEMIGVLYRTLEALTFEYQEARKSGDYTSLDEGVTSLTK